MKAGSKHTPEARAKVSASLRGRKLSPEHRAKLSAVGIGRKHSEEAKERMAAAHKNRSEETRAKLSAALTGLPKSAEHRARISASLRGRKLSKEHVANVSAALHQGENIGYAAAHSRADKVLPRVCAFADETCSKKLDAAFRHDTPAEFVKRDKLGVYSAHPEHYMRLCGSHHQRYDHANKARKTHCKRGHEFTPENTYVTSKGWRMCKACGRQREAERQRRKAIKGEQTCSNCGGSGRDPEGGPCGKCA